MNNDAVKSGLSADGFRKLIDEAIPLAVAIGVEVVEVNAQRARLRLPHGSLITRPGATIAGPPMMAVADIAMYAAILGRDSAATATVTSNFNMNFLRAAQDADILIEAEIIRMGRRLIYLQAYLYCDGDAAPIAHVTATYARP